MKQFYFSLILMSFAFYVKAQCSFTISQLPNPACNDERCVELQNELQQGVKITYLEIRI